jgi:hypothetical protein
LPDFALLRKMSSKTWRFFWGPGWRFDLGAIRLIKNFHLIFKYQKDRFFSQKRDNFYKLLYLQVNDLNLLIIRIAPI